MEESAPSSVAWWKYVVWTALIVAVFLSSIAGGHWWSSRSYRAPQESANTTSDTPTQRMPGPVVLEVTSELEAVRLQSSVDTAALAHWWQILGVDSQALTFKELGGWATYTPQSVKIVIKDISPLNLAERQALFNPVSDGLGGEPVAGSATVYDPAQPETLEYHVYHHPMLYLPEYSDTTEENINRVLFETLYVAVVGSTALTPDDYAAKRETAFPPGGGWQGIVKLEGTGTSGLWHAARGTLATGVQKVRQWQLVPKAHAQSCGGTFYCGVSSTQCKCSSTNLTCTGGSGSSCGPNDNKGTCNCTTTCPSDPNLKNDCVKIGNVCGPRSNSCSNCVSEDFYACAWSGPTPTTGSGQPTPTDAPADYGERCRIDGKVEYYDNRNLTNAANVVNIRADNINENYGTDGSGNYSMDKKYSNVWGNTI